MRRLQILTNSEVETYRNCGAKHGFAYQQLLRPRIDGEAKPAGSILHAGIEAGWRAAWEQPDTLDGRLQRAIAASAETIASATLDECKRVALLGGEGSDELIAKLEGQSEALRWSVENYFRATRPDLDYVPVCIERQFSFLVPTDRGNDSMVSYQGKTDLVLWDREANRLIVQDHKGTGLGVRQLERKIPLDTQLSGYVFWVRKALRDLAAQPESPLLAMAVGAPVHAWETIRDNPPITAPVVGSIAFNVLRRKQPETPGINILKKNEAVTEWQRELLALQATDGKPRGLVSVADCDTTPGIYGDALTEQLVGRGLEITDKQRERLEKIRHKAGFFAQLEYYRGEAELERWRRELLLDAKKIRYDGRAGQRSRNPGACAQPWSPPCAYATVCQAPADPVALAQYVVVDRPHQELEQQDHGSEEDQQIHDYI